MDREERKQIHVGFLMLNDFTVCTHIDRYNIIIRIYAVITYIQILIPLYLYKEFMKAHFQI